MIFAWRKTGRKLGNDCAQALLNASAQQTLLQQKVQGEQVRLSELARSMQALISEQAELASKLTAALGELPADPVSWLAERDASTFSTRRLSGVPPP